MSVSRRGFLGSVIGFLAGTGIPFVAERVSYTLPSDKITKVYNYVKLFTLPEEERLKCRIYLINDNRVKFWGPKLIKATIDTEGGDHPILELYAEHVEITKPIINLGHGIVDNRDNLITEWMNENPINLVPGDMLKVHHKIELRI